MISSSAFGQKKLSILIDKLIPEHLREQYPTYVTFVSKYYQYLERKFAASDALVVTSFNSTVWKTNPSSVTEDLSALATGYLIQYAVGANGSVASSVDGGITWAEEISFTSSNLHDITATSTLFVAIGDNGELWVRPNLPSEAVQVGQPTTALWSRVYLSNDTIQLREIINNTVGSTGGTIYVLGGLGYVYYSTDGGASWNRYYNDNINTTDTLTVGASFKSLVFVAGEGSSRYFSINNGESFTDISGVFPVGLVPNDAAYATINGKHTWVVVGDSGQIYYSSDPLSIWLQGSTTTSAKLNHVTWSSLYRQFFAVGSAGTVVSSADGVTWSLIDIKVSSSDLLFVIQSGRGAITALTGKQPANALGGEYYIMGNLLGLLDIDQSKHIPAFMAQLKKHYIGDSLTTIAANLPNLIKHIRTFYQIKGSAESYRILFRALFNTNMTFFYPKEKIFSISGSGWNVPRLMLLQESYNREYWQAMSMLSGLDIEANATDQTISQHPTAFVTKEQLIINPQWTDWNRSNLGQVPVHQYIEGTIQSTANQAIAGAPIKYLHVYDTTNNMNSFRPGDIVSSTNPELTIDKNLTVQISSLGAPETFDPVVEFNAEVEQGSVTASWVSADAGTAYTLRDDPAANPTNYGLAAGEGALLRNDGTSDAFVGTISYATGVLTLFHASVAATLPAVSKVKYYGAMSSNRYIAVSARNIQSTSQTIDLAQTTTDFTVDFGNIVAPGTITMVSWSGYTVRDDPAPIGGVAAYQLTTNQGAILRNDGAVDEFIGTIQYDTGVAVLWGATTTYTDGRITKHRFNGVGAVTSSYTIDAKSPFTAEIEFSPPMGTSPWIVNYGSAITAGTIYMSYVNLAGDPLQLIDDPKVGTPDRGQYHLMAGHGAILAQDLGRNTEQYVGTVDYAAGTITLFSSVQTFPSTFSVDKHIFYQPSDLGTTFNISATITSTGSTTTAALLLKHINNTCIFGQAVDPGSVKSTMTSVDETVSYTVYDDPLADTVAYNLAAGEGAILRRTAALPSERPSYIGKIVYATGIVTLFNTATPATTTTVEQTVFMGFQYTPYVTRRWIRRGRFSSGWLPVVRYSRRPKYKDVQVVRRVNAEQTFYGLIDDDKIFTFTSTTPTTAAVNVGGAWRLEFGVPIAQGSITASWSSAAGVIPAKTYTLTDDPLADKSLYGLNYDEGGLFRSDGTTTVFVGPVIYRNGLASIDPGFYDTGDTAATYTFNANRVLTATTAGNIQISGNRPAVAGSMTSRWTTSDNSHRTYQIYDSSTVNQTAYGLTAAEGAIFRRTVDVGRSNQLKRNIAASAAAVADYTGTFGRPILRQTVDMQVWAAGGITYTVIDNPTADPTNYQLGADQGALVRTDTLADGTTTTAYIGKINYLSGDYTLFYTTTVGSAPIIETTTFYGLGSNSAVYLIQANIIVDDFIGTIDYTTSNITLFDADSNVPGSGVRTVPYHIDIDPNRIFDMSLDGATTIQSTIASATVPDSIVSFGATVSSGTITGSWVSADGLDLYDITSDAAGNLFRSTTLIATSAVTASNQHVGNINYTSGEVTLFMSDNPASATYQFYGASDPTILYSFAGRITQVMARQHVYPNSSVLLFAHHSAKGYLSATWTDAGTTYSLVDDDAINRSLYGLTADQGAILRQPANEFVGIVEYATGRCILFHTDIVRTGITPTLINEIAFETPEVSNRALTISTVPIIGSQSISHSPQSPSNNTDVVLELGHSIAINTISATWQSTTGAITYTVADINDSAVRTTYNLTNFEGALIRTNTPTTGAVTTDYIGKIDYPSGQLSLLLNSIKYYGSGDPAATYTFNASIISAATTMKSYGANTVGTSFRNSMKPEGLRVSWTVTIGAISAVYTIIDDPAVDRVLYQLNSSEGALLLSGISGGAPSWPSPRFVGRYNYDTGDVVLFKAQTTLSTGIVQYPFFGDASLTGSYIIIAAVNSKIRPSFTFDRLLVGNLTVSSTGEIVGDNHGTYLNNNSRLDEDSYIQDNYYYQTYSYEIHSEVSQDFWGSLIQKVVHPAGMKAFAKIVLVPAVVVLQPGGLSTVYDIVSNTFAHPTAYPVPQISTLFFNSITTDINFAGVSAAASTNLPNFTTRAWTFKLNAADSLGATLTTAAQYNTILSSIVSTKMMNIFNQTILRAVDNSINFAGVSAAASTNLPNFTTRQYATVMNSTEKAFNLFTKTLSNVDQFIKQPIGTIQASFSSIQQLGTDQINMFVDQSSLAIVASPYVHIRHNKPLTTEAGDHIVAQRAVGSGGAHNIVYNEPHATHSDWTAFYAENFPKDG